MATELEVLYGGCGGGGGAVPVPQALGEEYMDSKSATEWVGARIAGRSSP